MQHRRFPARAGLALASLLFAACALAQSPQRAGPPASPARAAQPAASPTALPERTLDRVVAVINDEALTQYEINEQKRAVLAQMETQKVTPPAPDVLERQLVERMVTERALLQFAKETGIKVDDTQVERTIQRIAEENKITPAQLRDLLAKEHIAYDHYREDIRRQIVLQRLREREVENRITVSDAEVDNYLATVAAQAGGEHEYLLSHILVSVPDQASPDVVQQRQRKAEEALRQLREGADFAQVAAAMSDAPDALQGGSLGWRSAARLPTIFTERVSKMAKGDVSELMRSPAGFHIVKLMDVRDRNQPTVVEQTHVRHILVKVNEVTSEAEARARVERLRERIEGGAKFEDLARVNSEDASSAKGGDLGWVNPGDTVPDFETAMNDLKVNELSKPIRSPFGFHLIQVLERRKQDITREREREQARLAIRQRKADEAFQEFVRQTRDRAYVEVKTDEK